MEKEREPLSPLAHQHMLVPLLLYSTPIPLSLSLPFSLSLFHCQMVRSPPMFTAKFATLMSLLVAVCDFDSDLHGTSGRSGGDLFSHTEG